MQAALLGIIVGLAVLFIGLVGYGIHQQRKIIKRRAAEQQRQASQLSSPRNPVRTTSRVMPSTPRLAPHSPSAFSDLPSSITGFWGEETSTEQNAENVYPVTQPGEPVFGLPLAFSHFSEIHPQTPRRRTATPGPPPRDGRHFPLESGDRAGNGLGNTGTSLFPGALPRSWTRSATPTPAGKEFFESTKSTRQRNPQTCTSREMRAALGVLNNFTPSRDRRRRSRSPRSRSERRRHNSVGRDGVDDGLGIDGVEIEELSPLTGKSFGSTGPSEGRHLRLRAISLGGLSGRRSNGGSDTGRESPHSRRTIEMYHLRAQSSHFLHPEYIPPAPTPFPTDHLSEEVAFWGPEYQQGIHQGFSTSTRGAEIPSRMQTMGDDEHFSGHKSLINMKMMSEEGEAFGR